MDDLWDLSGRVALVTGGSRGLGREMVLAFAAAGADVIITSRKQDACDAVAAEVTDAHPDSATLAHACHVGRWDDIDGLIATAYDRFGRVDVLVNNAGMSPLYESVDAVTEELYDKVMAVNLKGPYRLASVIGARMAEGDGGSIINVSSIAAVQPSPIEIPYATAKAGLNNLTLGLAGVFGPKVRVNTIMPGPFLTDIADAWDMDAFNKAAEQNIWLGRGGEPHEVVGAALYFASDASSFCTGATLRLDGGTR